MIRVKIEGKGTAVFPDGTPEAVIHLAVQRDFFNRAPSVSEKAAARLGQQGLTLDQIKSDPSVVRSAPTPSVADEMMSTAGTQLAGGLRGIGSMTAGVARAGVDAMMPIQPNAQGSVTFRPVEQVRGMLDDQSGRMQATEDRFADSPVKRGIDQTLNALSPVGGGMVSDLIRPLMNSSENRQTTPEEFSKSGGAGTQLGAMAVSGPLAKAVAGKGAGMVANAESQYARAISTPLTESLASKIAPEMMDRIGVVNNPAKIGENAGIGAADSALGASAASAKLDSLSATESQIKTIARMSESELDALANDIADAIIKSDGDKFGLRVNSRFEPRDTIPRLSVGDIHRASRDSVGARPGDVSSRTGKILDGTSALKVDGYASDLVAEVKSRLKEVASYSEGGRGEQVVTLDAPADRFTLPGEDVGEFVIPKARVIHVANAKTIKVPANVTERASLAQQQEALANDATFQSNVQQVMEALAETKQRGVGNVLLEGAKNTVKGAALGAASPLIPAAGPVGAALKTYAAAKTVLFDLPKTTAFQTATAMTKKSFGQALQSGDLLTASELGARIASGALAVDDFGHRSLVKTLSQETAQYQSPEERRQVVAAKKPVYVDPKGNRVEIPTNVWTAFTHSKNLDESSSPVQMWLSAMANQKKLTKGGTIEFR